MTKITNVSETVARDTLAQWQLPPDVIEQAIDWTKSIGSVAFIHHGVTIRVIRTGNYRYTLENSLDENPESG